VNTAGAYWPEVAGLDPLSILPFPDLKLSAGAVFSNLLGKLLVDEYPIP
jgi:hypothetical protein